MSIASYKVSSIYNLDRLVHKGVRTKDGIDLGNFIAADESYLLYKEAESQIPYSID